MNAYPTTGNAHGPKGTSWTDIRYPAKEGACTWKWTSK